MQVEFLGGDLIAGTATQEHPQRLTQPPVVLVIGGKVAKHGGHPIAGAGHVITKARHDGQARVGRRNHRRRPAACRSPRRCAQSPPRGVTDEIPRHHWPWSRWPHSVESGRAQRELGGPWSTASATAARYGSQPHPQLRSAATKSGLAAAPAASPRSRRNRCSRASSSPSAPASGYHMTSPRWCHRSG